MGALQSLYSVLTDANDNNIKKLLEIINIILEEEKIKVMIRTSIRHSL